MQSNFPNCLTFTLHYEGGYCNNARDPGGPTNLGITIATLSHELGHPATIAEVKALTVAQAGEIYRKKYWGLIGGDTLPAGVDLMLFDIAVNMGVGRAMQWSRETSLMPPIYRLHALDKRRRGFWQILPTFHIFGRGWFARENSCFAAADAMIVGKIPTQKGEPNV